MSEVELPSRAEQIETRIRAAHQLADGGELMILRIFKISEQIPQNINDIDPPYARYLSGLTLSGMSMCGEMYPMAVSYEMKMDSLKKSAFSRAMMVTAMEAGFRSAKDREQFAFSDADYIAASDLCIEAKMFKTLVEEKKQLFLKAHHLMKDIVSKDTTLGEDTAPKNIDDWARRVSRI